MVFIFILLHFKICKHCMAAECALLFLISGQFVKNHVFYLD